MDYDSDINQAEQMLIIALHDAEIPMEDRSRILTSFHRELQQQIQTAVLHQLEVIREMKLLQMSYEENPEIIDLTEDEKEELNTQ